MDFILRKIENKLMLNDPGSYEFINCLKIRIEYSLFLCLGFLWKNLDDLTQEKRSDLFVKLNNLSIGSTVAAIRELDHQHNEILVNKKCSKLIDDYPAVRNSKIGHGYDMADSIASVLVPLYNDLVKDIPILREECDIIIVKSYDIQTHTYNGIRLPSDKNGEGVRWSCPTELLERPETEFPRTYISYKNKYYKISPFIFIDEKTQDSFVFSSLIEKIIGKTKLCPLFPGITDDGKTERIFKELIYLCKSDGYRLFSQSNGTIMNSFTPNYSQYIDVGFQNLVKNFLFKNRAYVTATIWGHGGIGKTACIQKMCFDLFNDAMKHFSYIVFITAKDRVYNTKTGKIDLYKGNIRLYSEVLETIIRTVFDCADELSNSPDRLTEYEQRISEFEEPLLIVIDDYETFEDSEKEKISTFLSTLNARYHKAIVTTRNNRFVIGEPIPYNELSLPHTKTFIEQVVKSDYKDHLINIQKLITDPTNMNRIYEATSGRPIFIYQFIHLYVQRGYQSDFIKGIRTSADAQEFLYGRIVQYLSKNAQYLFATISVLVDEDLRFNFDVLEHVLSKIITDKDQFESGLDEILDQKVVERLNDVYGRVYSPELFKIMSHQYTEYPKDFRSTVKNLLDGIGGKNIKGGIMEAMLEQADKSRALGNEKETVEKYRRVLNNAKCPNNVKKNALKHMADYLSNARLNPISAVKAIEEYLSHFTDDAEIYIFYTYLLWSQGIAEKEKAVNTIRSFFANSNHQKTAPQYLTFFALGTGYCIDYDFQYREYAKEQLRKAQYSSTFNEYGKELFDYIKSNKLLKGKAALFHNIRVALIQTIKLCYALSKSNKNLDKAEYGLSICTWLRDSDVKEPFLNQINRWESELKKVIKDSQHKNNIDFSVIPQPRLEFDSEKANEEIDRFLIERGQYHIGDTVEVVIKNIKSFGVFADINGSTSALIHISEIEERYIENIHDEFMVGERCFARIISIDEFSHKISLSTKGLRKKCDHL